MARRNHYKLVSKDKNIVKKYSSKWLQNIISTREINDDEFFDFVMFLSGDKKEFTSLLQEKFKAYGNKNENKKIPQKVINRLLKASTNLFSETVESVYEDYPCAHKPLGDTVKEIIQRNLREPAKLVGKNGKLEPLKQMFNLEDIAIELCFFIFCANNYEPVKQYFIHELECLEYENLPVLATMLGTEVEECLNQLETLSSLGIIEKSGSRCLLSSGIDKFIKGIGTKNLRDMLCAPLGESELALEEFNIPEADKRHIQQLLKCERAEPCHILLYGNVGTGKSSFAKTLASELSIKAFQVVCPGDDEEEDRKVSLSACLNVSRKYPGSFVVVDECEDILNISSSSFGTNKYWINNLLEEKNNKVIWICNDVRFINPAIKRRFSYSVQFPELTDLEQRKMWRKNAIKLNVSGILTDETIGELVRAYKVPVSCIAAALEQAKAIATKNDFVACIKRNLQAYITLTNNGLKPKIVHLEPTNFLLDGISTSMHVNEYIERIKRIKIWMEKEKESKGGMGNILFYGISGAGKSELAKYTGKVLEHPCLIKRASQLISPYVGETEINIRKAFDEASNKGAVLILDECDSFIPSRENTTQNYEVTMTNEFLTCLEEYRGICICTTNFRKCLDSAVMRRFSIKIEFGYASPSQLVVLYRQLLAPLVNMEPEVEILETLKLQKYLAVGDFQNVRNQYLLEDKDNFSHQDLLNALLKEQNLKLEAGTKKLGFAM